MDQLKGLSLQGIMKAIKLKSLKISMDWSSIKIKWVKWTTYLMKVYLGKLCVSSNLIQCKSAIHVIYHIQKSARDHLLRLIVLLMCYPQNFYLRLSNIIYETPGNLYWLNSKEFWKFLEQQSCVNCARLKNLEFWLKETHKCGTDEHSCLDSNPPACRMFWFENT